TSTRSLKTDINYTTASSSEDMLNQLVNLKVATYRYKIENQQDPLRIGLISEDTRDIAPEILSADGKGIDLYKLATFTLAGVQALAARVDAQETRIISLESRVEKLETGAIGSASGSPLTFASSTEQITSWFADAGNGIGEMIAKTFRASEKICVDDQCLTKEDVRGLLALVHPQTATTTPSTSSGQTDSGITITSVATSTPPVDTASSATSTPSTSSWQADPLPASTEAPLTSTDVIESIVITDAPPVADDTPVELPADPIAPPADPAVP
ncbi:MAG: tail fiber domain-containing protein, partial [Candidatus Parcubacteria bacterium]|nr:tail fiber domain-containing protein [Candidatus Parcubacteria bacterium]